jgi:methionyl-tRNA synthetase
MVPNDADDADDDRVRTTACDQIYYRAGDAKPLRVFIASALLSYPSSNDFNTTTTTTTTTTNNNNNNTTMFRTRTIRHEPWQQQQTKAQLSSKQSKGSNLFSSAFLLTQGNKENSKQQTIFVHSDETKEDGAKFMSCQSMNAALWFVRASSSATATATATAEEHRMNYCFQEFDEKEFSVICARCCFERDYSVLIDYLLENEQKLTEMGIVQFINGNHDSTNSSFVSNEEIAFFSSAYPVLANSTNTRTKNVFSKTRTSSKTTSSSMHEKKKNEIESWFKRFSELDFVKRAIEKSKVTAEASFQFAAQEGQTVSDLLNASNAAKDPSSENFSITTAINYANGAPHMGHAYEGLSADVIARYHRAYGRPTLFQTGADEHGQKISDAAIAAECKPIELCDKHVKMFQDLNVILRVENDVYNRTTSEKHKRCCRELFERSEKNGDIYLDTYTGWYNVREETFITETEAKETDYKDPVSGKPLKQMEEESYFFRQSKYQERLIKHIEENQEFIQPESKRGEILYRLKNDDLRDLSVSRTTFDWGIPVPGNSKHVLYVWFDALTNYITGCDFPDGENFKKFWPASVHIIGKDIIWFHCVIWPCMLMSCNIALPKAVFAHGFVTAADGQKMSKSIGNVVDPLDVLERCSPDTFRYALMRNGIYGSDIPFSEESMTLIHNADLADTLGNLVHRATHLCSKNCEGKVPDVQIIEKVIDVGLLRLKTERAMESFQLQQVCELAINSAKAANKYITDAEPWKLKGDETKNRRDVIIRTTLEAVYITALFLQPFIPTACEEIFKKIGMSGKTHKLWELKPFGENVKPGTIVSVGEVLFQKHEIDTAELAKKAQTAKDEKAAKMAKQKNNNNNSGEENTKIDVTRLDLCVGEITKVWNHPDAEALYVEEIDIGLDLPIQVCSGLVKHIPIDKMLGLKVVLIANMKPSKMRGIDSQAMVLCATDAEDLEKVEIVQAPLSSKVGERVYVDGYEQNPDDKLNPKKKVFEQVQVDFSVNKSGQACYKGVPFSLASGGFCFLESIKDGTIR